MGLLCRLNSTVVRTLKPDVMVYNQLNRNKKYCPGFSEELRMSHVFPRFANIEFPIAIGAGGSKSHPRTEADRKRTNAGRFIEALA